MTVLSSLKIKGFLKTTGMVAIAESLKKEGFKPTIKKFGWKVFAVIFMAYLIRDIFIYILVPWWITNILTK